MIDHFDSMTDHLLKSLDLSKANPENVVKLIKENYNRESLAYFNTLTYYLN